MTGLPDDRDLAGQFARLRREQREAASTFGAVTARPAPRRRRRVPFVGLAAAVVAAIVIGGNVIRHEVKPHGAREQPPVIDLRSARWVAPTDFLLNVPGDWLLRDLPRIAAPASFRFDTVTYRRISS